MDGTLKRNLTKTAHTMKRIFTILLLSVFTLTSCTESNFNDQNVVPTTQFVVNDFPAFKSASRVIGIEDIGKTDWEVGDHLMVTTDSGSATITLSADGVWTPDRSITGINNNSEIWVTYAPNCELVNNVVTAKAGTQYGTEEYFSTIAQFVDGVVTIAFGDMRRTYSRLRIATEAKQTITVTTTDFYPAGAVWSAQTEPYTLTADDKGNAYLYGTFAEEATVTVHQGDTEFATHTFNVATEAGKSYALFAGKKVDVDLSTLAATYVINDDAYYTFTGTGSYGIKVESGNPTIILNNVSITVGKEWDNENIVNAIDIVADNSETTVWITGTNNLTSNSGAGIYVKSGSTVIIKSDSRDNILTARAGMDGAGIGGTGYDFSYENVTCGNIYIENITVNAYSSGYMSSNPGIGAITSCGTITIKNATVTALGSNQGGVLYGGEFCPAIGASTVPDIVIENSTINAYRGDSKDGGTGSLADWIGAVIIYDPYSGDTPHTPGIQCGNGYIISTTVNKFLYKASSGVTKEEGSVTYDADGNPTEQAAE